MIIPKISAALTYAGLIVGGFVGQSSCESTILRGMFCIAALYGLVCFVVTRSWRSFVLPFVAV